MAIERGTRVVPDVSNPFEGTLNWRAGAVAGFVASLVMGLAISLVQLDTLRIAIAGLYGFEGSLVVGWLAHLAHGTLFGLVFAAVLSDPGLYHITDWWWKTLMAALVYALILAVAGAGIVMPIWMGFVGLPTPETIPYVTVPLLAWHLVYGLTLGVVYPFAERAVTKESASEPKAKPAA